MNCILDFVNGVKSTEIKYENVDLKYCLKLLNKLDQKSHTIMTIYKHSDIYVMIGGGLNSYIVSLYNGLYSYSLFDFSKNENKILKVCAGGQIGDYPETLILDRENVENCIRKYFSNTEMELNWERD